MSQIKQVTLIARWWKSQDLKGVLHDETVKYDGKRDLAHDNSFAIDSHTESYCATQITCTPRYNA